MAKTWEVKITPLDVARKEASVTATRTDSVTGKVETHNIITCLLVTAAQKTAVLDQLWSMHLAEATKQTAITAYIGTLEAQAKANLEARET
jgi:hypothetical protein